MSCDISLGRKEPCKDKVGGLRAAYFFNFDDFAVTYDGTDTHVITDIDDGAATPGAATAYKYDLKDTSNLVENITPSRENGTTYVEQVLTLQLKSKDKDTHNQIMLMAYGRPGIVIHDNNGDAWFCGVERGMDMDPSTTQSGAALGDLSGYNVIFKGMERILANYLDGSTLADPFAGMTTAPTIVEGT